MHVESGGLLDGDRRTVVAGTLAIICLTYRLAECRVMARDHLGNVGEEP